MDQPGLVHCAKHYDNGRRGGSKQGMRQQGTCRRFHCRAATGAGTVPVHPVPATPNATPATETGLTTIYAVHTLAGERGDIFIQYAGTYNFTSNPIDVTLPNGSKYTVQPLTAGPEATWVITGGTGAYTGLQGSGNADANAQNTFPWINHNSWGTVWWSEQYQVTPHMDKVKPPRWL